MLLKKILATVSAAAMSVTILTSTMPVSAETASGKCGENVVWSLDRSTGIFTISGTGDMYSYNRAESWGYHHYRDDIKEVIIEEGITSIGNEAFRKTPLSGDLVLPKSLKYIGADAFFLTNITSVNLNEGMYLGGGSFGRCNYIKEVIIPKDIDFLASPTPNAMRQNAAFFNCELLEKVIIKGGGLVGAYDKIENGLGQSLFSKCNSLKEIIIESEDIEYVEAVTFHVDGQQEYGTFWLENNPTFYIYKNSTTEKTLRDAGYLKDATDENEANYVYFADCSELEAIIEEAEGIDTSKYTEESVSALTEALENGKDALEKVKENIVEAKQEEIDEAVKAIKEAIKVLEEKKEPTEPSEPSSDNSSDNPTEPTSPTNTEPTKSPTNTPNVTTKPSDSIAQAKADAQKIMNQAKITKLKVKSKKAKKIVVSWKKVNKAIGYEVQVAKNNKFKKNKIVFDKFTKKKKLIFKNKIKSGTTYFVRVRAYATYKDEKNKARKVYSKWIKKVRKVKVK